MVEAFAERGCVGLRFAVSPLPLKLCSNETFQQYRMTKLPVFNRALFAVRTILLLRAISFGRDLRFFSHVCLDSFGHSATSASVVCGCVCVCIIRRSKQEAFDETKPHQSPNHPHKTHN